MGIWPGDDFYEYRYEYAEEYVTIMRQLWETGVSDFKGRFFSLDDCRCMPLPKGDIKIVCAGASPRGRRFTAEYGDYNFTSASPGPAGLAEVNEALSAETERSGRPVSSYPCYMVIIDDTDEGAQRKIDHYNAGTDVDAVRFMTGQAALDTNSEGTSAKMAELYAKAVLMQPIAGSPSTVARQIDELAAVPGTGGMMLIFDDFVEGVERFGSEVMPLLDCRPSMKVAV
jgi:pyrimidine oxygenase